LKKCQGGSGQDFQNAPNGIPNLLTKARFRCFFLIELLKPGSMLLAICRPAGSGLWANQKTGRGVWLKERGPGFGGLVRVPNKRQEFLWVHPQFEKEY
jgi:hypothetical protein